MTALARGRARPRVGVRRVLGVLGKAASAPRPASVPAVVWVLSRQDRVPHLQPEPDPRLIPRSQGWAPGAPGSPAHPEPPPPSREGPEEPVACARPAPREQRLGAAAAPRGWLRRRGPLSSARCPPPVHAGPAAAQCPALRRNPAPRPPTLSATVNSLFRKRNRGKYSPTVRTRSSSRWCTDSSSAGSRASPVMQA
nr:predicted GPI-anchored protein 58 isoform X2 [Camelus dromedarius]